jgi:hypothetical protein
MRDDYSSAGLLREGVCCPWPAGTPFSLTYVLLIIEMIISIAILPGHI